MRGCEAAVARSTIEGGREEATESDSVLGEGRRADKIVVYDSDEKSTRGNACKDVV